jgi:hypothetical protein
MATLKLNSYEIFTQSENNRPEFGAGVPSGMLMNVVQSVKRDTQQVGGNSSTYESSEEITGLSVTITPKLQVSNFLITVVIHVGASGGQEGLHFRLFKNGSVISGAQGDTSNSGTNKDRNFLHIGAHYTSNEMYPATGLYLDNNTGVSPITYSIRAKGYTTSYPGWINRAEVEQNDNTSYSRPISTITVMEIAA